MKEYRKERLEEIASTIRLSAERISKSDAEMSELYLRLRRLRAAIASR